MQMSVANARQTVLNPAIPFIGPIPLGLQPGEIVLIQGSVPNDADRFQLDLTCGSSTKPRADIALHFNPRFQGSPCIICNSLQQGVWGREEKHELMPFRLGAAFETIMLVHNDGFKVAVNGSHVLEYKHRIPLERIDTFSISGKVKIHAIGFIPNSAIFSESGDLSIPYRGSILRGVGTAHHITIKAQVSTFPHSFTVNLRCSHSDSIALHLNARIKSGLFIRNSLLSQAWGPEEIELDFFPFKPSGYFEMIILCQPHQFKVAVNGAHLLDYAHRVQDLRSVDQLEILGDLELQDVKMW